MLVFCLFFFFHSFNHTLHTDLDKIQFDLLKLSLKFNTCSCWNILNNINSYISRAYQLTRIHSIEIHIIYSKDKQIPHDILFLVSFLDQIPQVNNLIRSLENNYEFYICISNQSSTTLPKHYKKLRMLSYYIKKKWERKIVYVHLPWETTFLLFFSYWSIIIKWKFNVIR